MLVFAYDGSLNGDWVSQYAVRFAANTSERTLRLVHVMESSPEPTLNDRIARIAEESKVLAEESKVLGVALETELAPLNGAEVSKRLLEIVPEGATLIAGIRARPRRRTFLSGTVSARLFESERLSIIAMRVVHPGVLGQPGSVLLPIAGSPHHAALAFPLLRLLGRDLQHLHVLFVRKVTRLRFRCMSQEGAEQLLAKCRVLVAPIEDTLRAELAPHRFELDSSGVVSDDPPRDILLCASKYHSRLIALGASWRSASERVALGALLERLLHDATSDVAVFRGVG